MRQIQGDTILSKTLHCGNSLVQRLLSEGPKIHNDKFDYGLISQNTNLRKKDLVQIICPKHGLINVQVDVHLAGHNCLKCAQEDNATKRRRDQDKFINECKEKWEHSDEYYSKVNYIGNAYPITLACPEHGEFEYSSAKSHRRAGHGCQIWRVA